MPRGRGRGGGGHKGQRRHFTNPDQLAVDKEKEERERKWREQRGELSSEDSETEEVKEEKSAASSSGSSESSSDNEGEEGQAKAKGIQNLIEIENPNRVVKKDKKVAELQVDGKNTPAPQLSRREREELEKQKAKAHYLKMHAAGRTSEARADLARLAIIKKQREDALKKREDEAKAKRDADQQKSEAKKMAFGKKT